MGYVLERNGDQKAQIINRIKKAAILMKQVWRRRRFQEDWGRTIWLFDRLGWTLIGYGGEI